MGNKIIYKGHSIGETTQVSIMPTASVDHLGEIVQYVGPDTTTSPIYKKGKFYECRTYDSSYRWFSVDLVRGVNHAMYSEAWGGTDSKSDLIDALNAFHEDFMSAIEDCDINANVALYSCYVDTPYEGMPTNTQIKAYYDSDAGWVYRAYSFSTAEDFAIIPTGEAPNITEITITKLGGGSSGGGTKYYKHIITFRLKTPLEYYTDQPNSDYWKGTPGPNGEYITGMMRSNPNSQWVEMTNSATPGMGSEYNSDLSEHRINFTLGFISPVSNALTFDSAKSFYTSGKLIYLPLRPDTDTSQGNMTSASFNGTVLILHRDYFPVGDRTILGGGWDGEKYYCLKPWMIADWTDAVSEWKV